MVKEIKDSIFELEQGIREKQELIEMLRNLNIEEKLSEEDWHTVCESPLRSSRILVKLLTNIFPEATDVRLGGNFVYFTLYGIKCGLPTSRHTGIMIDTGWYRVPRQPKLTLPRYLSVLLEVYNGRKSHFDWYSLASIRAKLYKKELSKVGLFFAYFLKWKWEKINEEELFREVSKVEAEHQAAVDGYNNELRLRKEMVDNLFDKVIPELSSFSSKFFRMNNYGKDYTIEEIRKIEER